MSREHKYRGKRIDNGEWVYGSLLDRDIIVSGPVDVDGEYIGLGEWSSVDPETVGQYLEYFSLKCFEGDIIGIPCDCDSEYGCCHGSDKHEVVWDKEVAAFGLRQVHSDRIYDFDEFGEENLHLIGNRHDNPELLEVSP